jgi:hypothetical protein
MLLVGDAVGIPGCRVPYIKGGFTAGLPKDIQVKRPNSYGVDQINSFASRPSFVDRARSTAEKFHIFGSVHAMKTEIPPFDSEIKDLTNSSL